MSRTVSTIITLMARNNNTSDIEGYTTSRVGTTCALISETDPSLKYCYTYVTTPDKAALVITDKKTKTPYEIYWNIEEIWELSDEEEKDMLRSLKNKLDNSTTHCMALDGGVDEAMIDRGFDFMLTLVSAYRHKYKKPI